MTGNPSIDNPQFIEFLEKNRYFSIRELPDGTVAALHKLLFTTAICTGLNWICWSYRYCYDDATLAERELQRLQAMDDAPTGFVARR